MLGAPLDCGFERLNWVTVWAKADLADMLSLSSLAKRDVTLPLQPEDPVHVRDNVTPQHIAAGRPIIANNAVQISSRVKGAKFRAVIHHDSFGDQMRQVLGGCFARSSWMLVRGFNQHTMAREKPHLVILEMAERYLDAPPPGVRL